MSLLKAYGGERKKGETRVLVLCSYSCVSLLVVFLIYACRRSGYKHTSLLDRAYALSYVGCRMLQKETPVASRLKQTVFVCGMLSKISSHALNICPRWQLCVHMHTKLRGVTCPHKSTQSCTSLEGLQRGGNRAIKGEIVLRERQIVAVTGGNAGRIFIS